MHRGEMATEERQQSDAVLLIKKDGLFVTLPPYEVYKISHMLKQAIQNER